MLKHVVIWKIKDPTQKTAHAAEVKRVLEPVRGRIPGLLATETGIDIGCDNDADDGALYAEFADRAALEVCQRHPRHLDVKRIVGPLVTGRRVAHWEC